MPLGTVLVLRESAWSAWGEGGHIEGIARDIRLLVGIVSKLSIDLSRWLRKIHLFLFVN